MTGPAGEGTRMADIQPERLSWEPVRTGDRYCAPACGARCTWEAFQLAKARAEELANALGPEWAPVVHENMGWYWSVDAFDGHIHISPGDSGPPPREYTAFVSPNHPHSGRWIGRGATPYDALREALSDAEEELAEVSGIVTKLRTLIP